MHALRLTFGHFVEWGKKRVCAHGSTKGSECAMELCHGCSCWQGGGGLRG